MVESLNLDQIMEQSTRQICQCVLHSNTHTWAHWKVAKLQAHLQTHNICQYSPSAHPTIKNISWQKLVMPSIANSQLVWVLVSVPNGASDNTISNKFLFMFLNIYTACNVKCVKSCHYLAALTCLVGVELKASWYYFNLFSVYLIFLCCQDMADAGTLW